MQPQAQRQGGVGGAPSGSPEWGRQLGMGEPTGTGWVVACLFPMRVTVYFLIALSPTPNFMCPPKGPYIRNRVLAETRAIPSPLGAPTS